MPPLRCVSHYDVVVMGGFGLAAVAQQAPVSGSLAGSHAFWYGVLLAILIAWILPGWAAVVLLVIGVLASGVLHSAGIHAHSSSAPFLIILVIGLIVGLEDYAKPSLKK